jgi:septal ring factor EnvC (AmiA/AmiB activator)
VLFDATMFQLGSQVKEAEVAKSLASFEEQCRELETAKSDKAAKIAELEQNVKVMEAELHALSQQSAVKPDGQVDVMLTRKKRRLNGEYDMLLDRVASAKEELTVLTSRCVVMFALAVEPFRHQKTVSRRLHVCDEARRSLADEMHKLDSALLVALLDHQRALLQVAQAETGVSPTATPVKPSPKR